MALSANIGSYPFGPPAQKTACSLRVGDDTLGAAAKHYGVRDDLSGPCSTGIELVVCPMGRHRVCALASRLARDANLLLLVAQRDHGIYLRRPPGG
jgi:hypothetical protein